MTNLINSTTGVNFGLMIFSSDNEGGTLITKNVLGASYTTEIKDMSGTFNGTYTNEDALLQIISGLSANSSTPLAETFLDATMYFEGKSGAVH